MEFLLNLVQGVFAVAAIAPFITFIALYFILDRYMSDHKRAKDLTIDITTALLVISVSVMFTVVFEPGIHGIWIIVLAFLLAFGLAGGAQTRNKGNVNLKRTFRILWRMSFLLLGSLYILLFITGIIQSFIRG